ncbi:hypothetical protein FNU3_58 [Fusobacterium phage vB_FnuS_FNU3]|uniref:Uncharacterized protein n=1 Tax=Fusobacterium phage Fnu1 TaxID=2530024 RepID=A0A481W6V1_9CAUD|nr:hypothetical protein KMD24_gp148 [Fusobacterium phage Fnu1]QBJ04131.1 hypothetical protein [Fusobacterium phage Fnu1]WGH50258.1 hypothetical protein FNU2_72 [Fusobacterium phage vB_FnuS_FNU2]WGH50401.1 hypothetical protein FNU3_58 [Fusobacterium phage vB_FnuS_FNU3]
MNEKDLSYDIRDLQIAIEHCNEKVNTLKGDCQKEHYKLLMMLLDLKTYKLHSNYESNNVYAINSLNEIKQIREQAKNRQILISKFNLLVEKLNELFDKASLELDCKQEYLVIKDKDNEYWFDYTILDNKLKLVLISEIDNMSIQLYRKLSGVFEDILLQCDNLEIEVV